ncbi:FMN-binding negative transcriptional regulator [Chitinophaga rhizophila]|uniref:FMN-binding negative transcriptional regulator n=1 Tax=Chitinophaga rhizophila TaxID=2866212 RepID=A0ABS7GAC4_9BACT|nr:FMN-binding negative transcriptional regulator [Chitinophaga rhizophila]MBW8684611.1 FMN-binding negative transcriptional regulator [Chitinophaga rhizophila]
MYIPAVNRMEDREEIISFMQQFSFGTIVNSAGNIPVATHLPFHISHRDDQVLLTGHFARANDQWQLLEQTRTLVIFSEPHAYISPTNYEKQLEVPTWNYISVHAYGQAKIISDPEAVTALLESAINDYEAAYMHQWATLPESFKMKLLHGIVAFEIAVDDLQAKKKLSQNKTTGEQRRIIDSLSHSGDTNAVLTARYMEQGLKQE